MSCNVPEEQLWSWVDRGAPELEEHLRVCPVCRSRAADMQAGILGVVTSSTPKGARLPATVGSYVVRRLIGEGGQGVVYEAEQQAPRRLVALKVLKSGHCGGEQSARQFRREVETLGRLTHPAIATIHEAGTTGDGQRFLSLELARGVPLDAYVRDNGVHMERRLELFCTVGDAVHYAHSQGVVHRDLKPSNIIIDAKGEPKIVDFGLARLTDGDITISVTEPGRIMGTLRYMSPEQADGRTGEVGVPSDVYSLGVILYELLADEPPYEVGDLVPAAVRAICEEAPRRPSTIRRALRGDLETIVLKALEKEPARRYESVGALVQDVRSHLRGDPIRARSPSGLYLLSKSLSRHRVYVGAAMIALALGLVGVLWGKWWTGHTFERQRAAELAGARLGALGVQCNLEAEAGRPEDLMATAATLFNRYPDVLEVRLAWVQARWHAAKRLDDPTIVWAAKGVLQDGIARGPSPWAHRMLLAEVCRNMGDAEAAERLAAQAAGEVPDTAEAWYLRAFATFDLSRVRQCVEEAVKRDPRHELAWERLAYLCDLTGDVDRALHAADELIDLGQYPPRWLLFKGRVLMVSHRPAEALEPLTRAIELEPTSEGAYRHRARAYVCLGEYGRAVRDYDKVLAISGPGDAWRHYHRAVAASMAGDVEKAVGDYRESRKVLNHVSYADVRLVLLLRDQARLGEREGRVAEAQELRHQADATLDAARAEVIPGTWLAKVIDCVAGGCSPDELVQRADPEECEQVCEAYYYAGEVCLLDDRPDQARDYLQKCVDTGLVFDPTSPVDEKELMNEYHLACWRLKSFSGGRIVSFGS